VVNCIDPLIDTVVEKTGAVLIDFHTPFVDSIQYFPDKLHPDVEGSRIMAEILRDTILARDMIHQVETGLAFVSSFDQIQAPTALGDSAELSWVTIYADSVFLDGMAVDPSGSMKVVAEENRIYVLTAKGSKNTSDFSLKLNTYIPEKSGLIITPSSSDYENGDPVTLYAWYYDQYGRSMSEKTSAVIWTIQEGVGQFGEQTDTSIVFIPTAKGNVVVVATEGELSAQKTLRVYSYPVASNSVKISEIRVFPNPVDETLYFQIGSSPGEKIRITLFNLLGEQVLEQFYNIGRQSGSIFELCTSGMKQGIYIYAVHSNGQVTYGQFIKSTNHP